MNDDIYGKRCRAEARRYEGNSRRNRRQDAGGTQSNGAKQKSRRDAGGTKAMKRTKEEKPYL